ncbi:hypothetical protein [Burkholderia cepacia]|uniref:hypothetical protein n=1 Tax=Burkholderia cepacia TaxID=292 RepID=UPI003A5BA594
MIVRDRATLATRHSPLAPRHAPTRRPTAPRTFPTVCPVFSLAPIRARPGERPLDVAVHRSVRARHAFAHYPPVARMRVTPAAGTSLAR